MFDLFTNNNLSSFQAESLEEVIWDYLDYYTVGNGSDEEPKQIKRILDQDEKEIPSEKINQINFHAEEEILEWRRLSRLES